MASYYVNDNPQPNGDHEVHVSSCYWLAVTNNKTYLGEFSSCAPAVTEAKKRYSKSNGCATCSPACHTT